MARFWIDRTAATVAACLLAACGTNGIHQSAVAFSEAATATLDAESAISDRTDALAAAEKRSRGRIFYVDSPVHPNPQLTKPPHWTPDQLPQEDGPVSAQTLADRLACLQAVQAYAQAVETVTSGANLANVDSTTTMLFSSLSAAVKSAGGTFSPKAQGIAATAIDELGRVVVERLTTRTVVAAAKAAQPHLKALASTVSSEAVMESESQKRSLTVLSAAQSGVLNRVWHDRSVSAEGRFATWERVMDERNIQGVTVTEARINQALDALVKANDALASGDRQSFGTLADQALVEAQHAIATYQSASK